MTTCTEQGLQKELAAASADVCLEDFRNESRWGLGVFAPKNRGPTEDVFGEVVACGLWYDVA